MSPLLLVLATVYLVVVYYLYGDNMDRFLLITLRILRVGIYISLSMEIYLYIMEIKMYLK